jgi:hypothetical protein
MGDVVTALARAVQEEGHAVRVIVPKYDCLNYAEARGPAPTFPAASLLRVAAARTVRLSECSSSGSATRRRGRRCLGRAGTGGQGACRPARVRAQA